MPPPTTTRARCYCPREYEPLLVRAAQTHPHAARWALEGEWFELVLDVPHLSAIERGCERLRTERWLVSVVRSATRVTAYADWLASGGMT